MRGARVLGERVARTFLGQFTVLGRPSLEPGPIGAFGLGRLARGTESGPMVPTNGSCSCRINVQIVLTFANSYPIRSINIR